MSVQTGNEVLAFSGADAEEFAKTYPHAVIETPPSPRPDWATVQHVGSVSVNNDYRRHIAPQAGTGYNSLSQDQLDKLFF